jgi:hypothetical protein
MYKNEIVQGKNGCVILVDSITQLLSEDAGAIIVSGSHGGTITGEIALKIPVQAVFFNDAGVGKDNAGIKAIDILQTHGIAAGTVSYMSARIGDSLDMWENGIMSYVNASAEVLGFKPKQSLRSFLTEFIS